MLTSEQYHEMLAKDRQGILNQLEASGYITLLPPEQRGQYLIGTAKNDRAICLAWGDPGDLEAGRVTFDIMKLAYEEIAQARLRLPFLFFCQTCLVHSPDLFECMQIPTIYEFGGIMPVLRTLNLRGKPRLPHRSATA